ncbi:MAG: nucleoside 2-deoxyribosyltransferase [Hyphomicrobiaceae bacterium]
MTPPEPPRIYLAGPEVFLPNAHEIGAAKRAICTEYGLAGVFPLDGQLDLDGLPRAEQARRISIANEGLMYSCAATIANLTPFRGAAMDSGTAYEVGFMRALGKPVFGYTNVTADYAERARVVRAKGLAAGDFDAEGLEIEDFGLAENLMIAIAVSETGPDVVRHPGDIANVRDDLEGFRQSVAAAAEYFKENPTP